MKTRVKSKKAGGFAFGTMAKAILFLVIIVAIILAIASHARGGTSPASKLLSGAEQAAEGIPGVKELKKSISGSCYLEDAAFFDYGTYGAYYSNGVQQLSRGDTLNDCIFSPPSPSYGNANYEKTFYISQQFACPEGTVVTDINYNPYFADDSDTFSIFSPSEITINTNSLTIKSMVFPDRNSFSVNLPSKSLNTNAVHFMFGVEHKAAHSFNEKKGIIVTGISCA
ncbi:MAG: hypothetical protein HYT16_01885 [DPANN group archaeon]|nr:hypothetical protein [DPANN group archaeon]